MVTPTLLLICVVVSALVTAGISAYGGRYAEMFGLVDRPDGVRKIHAHATPLLGGLAILTPTLAISAGLLATYVPIAFLPIAVFSSTLLLVLGVLDDRFQLRALIRLVALACATILALSLEPLFLLQTLNMTIFGVPVAVSFGAYAGVATLIMVVGFVNASNMADGMNGQLLGSVLVWSLLLFYQLFFYADAIAGVPYLVLAASSLIALTYNLRGRIFSGSAGSYGVSFFIGLSAIATYHLSAGQMPAEVPLFWFYLPVLDCLRVSVLRISHRRSPLSPDRNHLHHILMARMSDRRALLVYLALLAAPGITAMIDHDMGWITLFLCVACYTFILVSARWHTSKPSARHA